MIKHDLLSIKPPIGLKFRLLESFIIITSVNYLLYSLFYDLSPMIWSKNIQVDHNLLMPPILQYLLDKDGVEPYVLYVFMLLSFILSFVSYYAFTLVKNKSIRISLTLILLYFTFSYINSIGFHLPNPSNEKDFKGYLFILSAVFILYYLYGLYYDYFKYIVVIGLIPICFIATDPFSVWDYGFILSPALRLYSGFPLSDIYMQYDLLLSLITAAFVQLNVDFIHFQIIGQLSFFIFLYGSFLFSRHFLLNKKNSILFLIALVLVRYFAIMNDAAAIAQVTPLRLDLWLVLLLILYYKGTYHWLMGVSVGFLLVFHRNFGIIYLSSYLLLIFTFFAIGVIEVYKENGMSFKSFKKIVSHHFSINFVNILIILFLFLLGGYILGGYSSKSIELYSGLGIGSMKTPPESFYWYIPLLFCLTLFLLFYNRRKLSLQYFSAGLFLILLAVGNLLYFLGRSHENNLLNISGVLVFTFFLFIDLLFITPLEIEFFRGPFKLPQNYFRYKPFINSCLPLLFIGVTLYHYSYVTSAKMQSKLNYFKGNRPLFFPINYADKLKAIQESTNHSSNVYLAFETDDALYYYYGKYKIYGYFSPFSSWVFKQECGQFLQDLLNKGFYVVTDQTELYFKENFPNLQYNSVETNDMVTAIRKISSHSKEIPN
jgi:hypothetical protein